MKKLIILYIANIISIIWRIIPSFLRVKFFFFLLILESRGNKKRGLKQLFLIKDKLNLVLNERALAYGNSIHPKHELMKYHHFFTDNIKNGENVLDIGCGYGAVAQTVASMKSKSQIVGLDYDQLKLDQASKRNSYENLKFENYDATKNLPEGKWDIIILSNVLEHINKRVLFLKKITSISKCKKILIRVPSFERSWEVPMRKKLSINYFSDDDHKIEHTLSEFLKEIKSAGLIADKVHTIWGEIWAVCNIKKD